MSLWFLAVWPACLCFLAVRRDKAWLILLAWLSVLALGLFALASGGGLRMTLLLLLPSAICSLLSRREEEKQ